MADQTVSAADGPRLRRTFGLWDLILIVIQPTAPMPVYGIMSQRAHGHAAELVSFDIPDEASGAAEGVH
jgi:putrescine importer